MSTQRTLTTARSTPSEPESKQARIRRPRPATLSAAALALSRGDAHQSAARAVGTSLVGLKMPAEAAGGTWLEEPPAH